MELSYAIFMVAVVAMIAIIAKRDWFDCEGEDWAGPAFCVVFVIACLAGIYTLFPPD